MFIHDGEHRCEVMAKLQELYDEICKSHCKQMVERNTPKIAAMMEDFCGASRRTTRRARKSQSSRNAY